MSNRQTTRWLLKPIVFLSALIPIALLLYRAFTDQLSANPISDITQETGIWTLRFLVITLAITPLRRITHINLLGQFRRMIGLFAFFYATLHFTTYIWLDQFFQFPDMLHDVAKRPFITVGFATFLMLIPLALTSTKGWIRRMGGKRWRALHRLVYAAGITGVIHYLWLVKADTQRPLIYGVLVGLLLLYRFVAYVLDRAKRSRISGTFAPKGVLPEESS